MATMKLLTWQPLVSCCPAGQLIIKDLIMLAAAVITLADSAKTALTNRKAQESK